MRATGVLAGLAPGTEIVPLPGDEGWLSVRIEPDRAAEVNRALAAGGIYASGLETGSDLETLFLELTGGELDQQRGHVRHGRGRHRRRLGPGRRQGGGGGAA